jgi:LysM repeat protein
MVRQGETLWGLAQQYGITVKALEQANPFLADRELRAGDRLDIPD